MKLVLGHIATIQTGIFAKPNSKGEIAYLQVKHFNKDYRLGTSIHFFVKNHAVADKHLLIQGDILFAAKGTNNFATCYNQDIAAVASTSFFVIRLNDIFQNKILPEFLAWHINHPVSQRFLKVRALGTSMASISKEALENLEVSIPDMQTQKNILKINQLQIKEKELAKEIGILQEKQIQQQLINAIKLKT